MSTSRGSWHSGVGNTLTLFLAALNSSLLPRGVTFAQTMPSPSDTAISFSIPQLPAETGTTAPFNGAEYPFPDLPPAEQIFSGQSVCRNVYSTCMDIFRDCLRAVGPIGGGANQLCELWRNDVCEEGVREGCDKLPPDSEGLPQPSTFTFISILPTQLPIPTPEPFSTSAFSVST